VWGEVDGDTVTFDYACTRCGGITTVTSYPHELAPDEPDEPWDDSDCRDYF
jgi:rRNA maturation protein Nop10